MPLQADGSWVAADGSYSRTREQYVADHSKDERGQFQYHNGPISASAWKAIWPTTSRYKNMMAALERAASKGS